MSRPALEVADIFRDHGAAWRRANAGHVSLDQMKVMSAIEHCRTAALGGHVARCEGCAHTVIAYNSCLMGKFRNGELAHEGIGLSVNSESFRSPLREAPWAGRSACLEVKGFFAQMQYNNVSMASRPRPCRFPRSRAPVLRQDILNTPCRPKRDLATWLSREAPL
jgi:hypothetical protein